MRAEATHLEFGKKKTTRIAATSCWHIGFKAIHEAGIHYMLKRFRQKRIPWWHLGDLVEGIHPDDPRFGLEQHQTTILQEMNLSVDWIKEAKKTCGGLIMGNHEWRLGNTIGNVTKQLADRAGVDYLGATCMMDVHCPDGAMKLFLKHTNIIMGGCSGEPERQALNRCIRLRARLKSFGGDLKLVGHGHQAVIAPPVFKKQLQTEGTKTKLRPTPCHGEWCAMAPAMYVNYSDDVDVVGYAEIYGYPPTDLGWIEAIIERDGTVAAVEHRMEDGKVALRVEPTVVA